MENESLIVFEGEYLNGKRNGIGKENFKRKILFEGEYKNGLSWNGKGYDNNNNVAYELKNGKGYVKLYNEIGRLQFEGDYLNGKKNGKVNQYNYQGKLEFNGEYLNNLRHGKGKQYSYDGYLEFEGEYFYGKKWNGKGYDQLNNVVYELHNGKGYIKEYSSKDKLKFEGEYLNGQRNGKGREYHDFCDKLKFEGEYLNGKKHGKAKEYNENGNLEFEGEYLYDHKLRGKFYINNKLEYEGEYLFDRKWNGKGYDGSGNIIYELNNGNGKVKEYDKYSIKLQFEGEYLNGLKNGIGKEYYSLGELKFEGEYKNGLKWNGKGYDGKNNIVYELKNGKGYVKEYDSIVKNLKFEGEYINGQKNGKGKKYDWDGSLIFEGEYINGLEVYK